ncbi:MAG: N-acetylmuramoyl-L-alanine amidase [Gammaproteobacteria bacterium]|nr:N-acetylmuramoyl-L-alanine amidase [Gammaproteobacteria bacterium]
MDRFSTTRRFFLKRLTRYGATLALLASYRTTFAKSNPALIGVRVSQTSDDHTRVVFDLSTKVVHKLFSLSDPQRIVIDLKDTHKSKALYVSKKTTSLMSGIRSASRNNGELRIVLDLKAKVRPRSFILKPDGNSGHRLVVDLHATNLSPTPIVTSQQQRQRQKKEIIIAIDPGHGGRDPGAIGKKGTREKDITLAVAKKMKTLINRTPGYRAVLTRESDRFVVLRNRVKKAREHQADLFLSIHADSFRSARVRGASVYALSLSGASSEAARWIAEKENASDLIGGISLDDKDDLIASVLLDLSQTATIQDSLELGSDVLRNLGKVSKLNNKKVQQAGFAVLKAPDMPSILIETAFLSNPAEEKKLRSSKHQQKLANALFAGIKAHMRNRMS